MWRERENNSYGWSKTSPFNHGNVFRTLANEQYNVSFTSDECTVNATKK